ncbi:MAG: nucleoside-diphosphate sugar epimerase/dehydratase [Oscillibacter sp.]|nr:nucleoside-diphosphate sugar epimerase/dehydratase [Oscillibacter sp.]
MGEKSILKRMFIAILDILIVNCSYAVALWIRFDFHFAQIPQGYIDAWIRFVPVDTVIVVVVFILCRMYHFVWHLIGFDDLVRIGLSAMGANALCVVGSLAAGCRLPGSVYLVGFLLSTALLVIMRYTCRILQTWHRISNRDGEGGIPTLLVGGGEAGRQLILENNRNRLLEMDIRCIIDDNPVKKGSFVEGKEIVGGREDIPKMVKKYDIARIVLAIPTLGAKEKRDVLEICKTTGCEMKIIPGIYQMVTGEVSVKAMREVSVEDLLGRDVIRVDNGDVFRKITDKVVMVTGGGGSIGSELCRQLTAHAPKQLIILDIYENNAYDIQQELKRKYPDLTLTVLIASVRDVCRMNQIFEKYRPQVVFHAAAHKHVPLMEGSPSEAIKNNVFGTLNTGKAAIRYGTEKFILISTDKAVNPTNIMGASKRVCEMVIQYLNTKGKTDFAAVRFGNVLGSNGSVIPLFKKQIENGGPVTVTHPDIIRYFMTIPEAVSLVLQTYAYAQGGEIFVLDMGEPVKIDDLARNMIRLSGLVPDVDISIVYTGLRPGEKLYEEMLMGEEGLQQTENKLIYIGRPIEFDCALFERQLAQLQEYCSINAPETREVVAEILQSACEGSADMLCGL